MVFGGVRPHFMALTCTACGASTVDSGKPSPGIIVLTSLWSVQVLCWVSTTVLNIVFFFLIWRKIPTPVNTSKLTVSESFCYSYITSVPSGNTRSNDFMYSYIIFIFFLQNLRYHGEWCCCCCSVPQLNTGMCTHACTCTSTGTLHNVRGLWVRPFSITPPCRQPHSIFRGWE